jgi:hypothetical protein
VHPHARERDVRQEARAGVVVFHDQAPGQVAHLEPVTDLEPEFFSL